MGGQRHHRGLKLFLPAVWCFQRFLHISDPALAANLSLPPNGPSPFDDIRSILQERTVKSLQAELRERGLRISGRKAVLVDRLVEIKTTTVWVRQLVKSKDCACQQLFLLPASLRAPGISLFFALHVLTWVVLAHMLDATQLRTHVPCYSTACARTVRILHGWGGGEGWGGHGCMRCLGTNVGCYAAAHTCSTEVCQKACAVEASLIDASILEWNSTCTATCGVSTTETGGNSSESCASNNEKKQTKTAKEVFFGGLGRSSQCKLAEF